MRLTASGGTDGASIVLFWPDNLPDDADAAINDDPVSLIERLQTKGKLIWFPCGADGGYTVAVYVRADLPPELAPHCKEVDRIASLVVRGNGCFGGMEYVFKHDRSFAGVLATIVLVFFVTWPVWFFVLAGTTILTLATIALSRTTDYRAVVTAGREFEREFPSYVVRLT